MSNILVTGANGQLGSELNDLVRIGVKLKYYFTDSFQLDITQKDKISKFVKENNINVIVNCAAYTNVDRAEEEQDLSDLINRQAVQNLAEVCDENNASLVHISTDYVFGGTKNTPYKETDATSPLGVYGSTKLAGEQAVLDADIDCLILRTSWLYSSYGNNFVKTIKRLSSEKQELRVVFDQVGTPTYALDLANFIIYIIENNLVKSKKGIYHFSNEGVCSWYDFAREIICLSNSKCKVVPCLSDEYPTRVTRPNYSVLDKTKLRNDFNYVIPYWRESLKKCIKRIENK